MSRAEAAEDLLLRARQGRLEEDEEKRVEVALQSSRELELLYRAGVQFDASASLLAGDEARLSALVARTLERLDQGAAPQTSARAASVTSARSSYRAVAVRYFAAGLASSLLLSVALASAWDYVEKRDAQARAKEAATEVARAAHAKPSQARSPALTLANAEATPAPSAATAESIPAPVVTASALASPAKRAPTSGGAAIRQPAAPLAVNGNPNQPAAEPDQSQLFAQANTLRRQGDVPGAIALYQRLSEQYPSSAEANDAQVLLGNLLLGQSSARAALQKFESYGPGALSLEALWGKAQALRTLGSPDERTVLETLVRDYPSSPYAAAAEKRLQALSP